MHFNTTSWWGYHQPCSQQSTLARSMEVMLQDPKMQEMMYPYLPEPMRNPETFNFVLKDPTMRKQLVSTLAQSVW